MKKIITSSFSLLLLLSNIVFADDLKTVTMKIEGMTCGGCVSEVESKLSSLCKNIKVNLEKGEGVCQYASPVTPDQIIAAANKTGYKTTVKITGPHQSSLHDGKRCKGRA